MRVNWTPRDKSHSCSNYNESQGLYPQTFSLVYHAPPSISRIFNNNIVTNNAVTVLKKSRVYWSLFNNLVGYIDVIFQILLMDGCWEGIVCQRALSAYALASSAYKQPGTQVQCPYLQGFFYRHSADFSVTSAKEAPFSFCTVFLHLILLCIDLKSAESFNSCKPGKCTEMYFWRILLKCGFQFKEVQARPLKSSFLVVLKAAPFFKLIYSLRP